MAVTKIWDKIISKIDKLKKEQGRINFDDSELPDTYFLYRIKKTDAANFDPNTEITTDYLIDYFSNQQTDAIAILTLEFVKEIKCKKISITKSQNPIEPASLSNYQKRTQLQFWTNWEYTDNRFVWLISKKALVQDEVTGFIENQDVYLVNYGDDDTGFDGKTGGWTITAESWNVFVEKNETSWVLFKFTFQNYMPEDCEFIEDQFEVAPFLSAPETYVLTDAEQNRVYGIDYESSISELFLYKIQFQNSGSSDYRIENNYLAMFRFQNEIFENFVPQEKLHEDANNFRPEDVAIMMSDENGILDKKNIEPAKDKFLDGNAAKKNCIPNSRYAVIGAWPYINWFASYYSDKLIKQNQEFYLGGGLSFKPQLQEMDYLYDRNNVDNVPWKNSNTLYVVDNFLTWSSFIVVWYFVSEVKENPKFDWTYFHNLNSSLLFRPDFYNNISIDQAFPDFFENSQSDANVLNWSKEIVEDRKHFVLFPASPKQMAKWTQNGQFEFKKIEFHTNHYVKLIDGIDAVTNQTKILSEWLRNKNQAGEKGIPTNWILKTRISKSKLYSITTAYTEGGKIRTIKFLKADGSLCTGTNEDGVAVPIPPLNVLALGNKQFGAKGNLKQTIFLGI